MRTVIERIVLVLSLLVNLALAYNTLDQGITVTHYGESIELQKKQIEVLSTLVNDSKCHFSQRQLESLAKQKHWEILYKKEDGRNLWIAEIGFTIRNQVVESAGVEN